jgi:hypothetical protein
MLIVDVRIVIKATRTRKRFRVELVLVGARFRCLSWGY